MRATSHWQSADRVTAGRSLAPCRAKQPVGAQEMDSPVNPISSTTHPGGISAALSEAGRVQARCGRMGPRERGP